MADNTSIEWADATVNAINGCTRVSPGCGGPGPHGGCYAERLAATRLRDHPSRPGLAIMTSNGPRWTGKVHLHEPELLKPLRWQKPRRIFWNAHGDIFHPAVPDEWIDSVFAVCALTPQHTHMILTKRSERMRKYLSAFIRGERGVLHAARNLGRLDDACDALADAAKKYRRCVSFGPLPNVWLGVSVEDQTRADERIPDLLATPAAKRFLSCEPLLGPVELRKPLYRGDCGITMRGYLRDKSEPDDFHYWATKIDWIIVGGESGPRARPMHPDWARAIRDQCADAGVPFFFKQWGEWRDRGGHVPIATRKVQSHICYLDRDTGRCKPHPNRFSDETMIKLGRKAAGRLLDGVEHNAFPGGAA